MAYRFNGGIGAITCDYCRIIFCTQVSPGKYETLRRIHGLSDTDPDLCPDPENCKDSDDVPRSLITQLHWSQNGR